MSLQTHTTKHVITLENMDTPSLNESDTDDSFMKRLIMHNRSQSEDVLRPQAFSRAQVRPRNNRLTLANLERLPVPEPPQVTTKSDLGSIESRSSSERSRNKLEAIRRRELEFVEDDGEEEEEAGAKAVKDELDTKPRSRRSYHERDDYAPTPAVPVITPTPAPISPPPSPPLEGRRSSSSLREKAPLTHEKARHSTETHPSAKDKNVLDRWREPSARSRESTSREKAPAPRKKSPPREQSPSREKSRTRTTSPPREDSPHVQDEAPTAHSKEVPVKQLSANPAAREGAQQIPEKRAISREKSSTRDRTAVSREKSASAPAVVEEEEGSDMIRIRNMDNHLKSLSANFESVKTGMENISKLTGKPSNGSAPSEVVLARMSDKDILHAVSRATWSNLWVFRHDADRWTRLRVGPGFWLILLLAIPFYAALECIACMIWCRPVFAESVEGLGIYPDAPELPYVIPTMVLRPLRPVWKPLVDVIAPFAQWLWDFVAYVAAHGKGSVF